MSCLIEFDFLMKNVLVLQNDNVRRTSWICDFSYVTCEWMLDDDNSINENITMRIYVYVYI